MQPDKSETPSHLPISIMEIVRRYEMSNRIDLTGNKYGRLEVLRPYQTNAEGRLYYTCKCECENETNVRADLLKRGTTKSCGCLKKEAEALSAVTHGLTYTNGKLNRLYRIWQNMKKRCQNTNDPNYKYYGGRGISVCEEWKADYINFH
ncbi:MAG: hypothetical protein WCL51_03835, partial [Bacteroidota bacterium]